MGNGARKKFGMRSNKIIHKFFELPGKRLTCLFTGGGGAGNEAIYKNLKYRYDLNFLDSNITRIHPNIPKSRKHQIPKANSKYFIHEIVKISKELGCDIIIPGVDEELLLLREYYKFKPEMLLLPSTNFIRTMIDKYTCMKELAKNLINIPKTYKFENFLKIKNFNFPYILKPNNGRGSRNVYKINSKEELYSAVSLSKLTPDDFIIQEFISGKEYTVSVISDLKGNLKEIVPVLVNEKKGITIDAQIDCNPVVFDICKKMHKKFKPAGTINIQLLLNEKNIPFIFEINPRVSTTLCMSIFAGVDPIQAFIQSKNIGKPSSDIRLIRHWNNHLIKI